MNPGESKRAIKNDAFTIFDNEYDTVKNLKYKELLESKAKTLGPAFKASKTYDNNFGTDWTLPGKVRETEI